MPNPKTIELPVLPLRGMLLFPGMVLHFDIGRPKSIAALEQSMMGNQKVFLVAQKDEETEFLWKEKAAAFWSRCWRKRNT